MTTWECIEGYKKLVIQDATNFQLECNRNADPEYRQAVAEQQATCPHGDMWPNGLCALCGKFTRLSVRKELKCQTLTEC
jgi:hypothetical protein